MRSKKAGKTPEKTAKTATTSTTITPNPDDPPRCWRVTLWTGGVKTRHLIRPFRQACKSLVQEPGLPSQAPRGAKHWQATTSTKLVLVSRPTERS